MPNLHPVARRILWRLASIASILLAAATLTFVALHLTPGDPLIAILGGGTMHPSPEVLAAARHEYGLDRPIIVQYALYLARLATGNLGASFSQHMPVIDVLRAQAPATLALMVSSLAAAWGLAVTSLLLAPDRGRARLARGLETVAAGLPQFWLGILLLWSLGFELRLFPPAGNRGIASLVLPTLTLAIPLSGFLARVMRESFDLAAAEPFALTARARGLSEWSVRLRHTLRHALAPGISLSAWAVSALVGNAVVVETIFSRRGIGRQLFIAIGMHDMPLVSGIVLFAALIYIAGSLIADALQLLVDPRLRTVHS